MGRPKGKPLPEAHREKIGRALRERARWTREFKPIAEAADAGDISLATELLLQYIIGRQDAAAASRPLTRHERAVVAAAKAQADAFDESQRQAEVNGRGPAWDRLARENRERQAGRPTSRRTRFTPRRGTA